MVALKVLEVPNDEGLAAKNEVDSRASASRWLRRHPISGTLADGAVAISTTKTIESAQSDKTTRRKTTKSWKKAHKQVARKAKAKWWVSWRLQR